MRRLTLLGGCAAALLLAAGCGGSKPDFTRKDREVLIGQAALSLRQAGLRDLRPGLERFATPAAIRKFDEFDRKVWQLQDARMGWSYFLNTSVMAFGNLEGEEPVAAFYHPWSDVFLLTAWKLDEDGPKLTDAEMLMGDFVRTKGELPLDPSPAWVRAGMFKPVAVGVAVGRSIRDFEELYPARFDGDWRGRIPNLNDPEWVGDINQAGAALMLATNLSAIREFESPGEDEDARLPALRAGVRKFLDAGTQSGLKPILSSAGGTLPAVKEVLLRMPPRHFGSYRPVSFLLGSDACIVFLVSTDNADFFLSCVFKGQGTRQKLDRVDLVSYEAMYRETPTLLAEAKEGR